MTALLRVAPDPNAPAYPGRGRPSLASGHRRVNQPGQLLWWHDAIIDEMLSNPQLTKREIAARVGCSYAYLLIISNSDVFLARFSQRRSEANNTVSESVAQRLNNVAARSLDLILDRLNSNDKIPLSQLESLADKSLAKLGYGQPHVAPAVAVNVNASAQAAIVTPATKEELERARNLVRVAESARSIGMVAGPSQSTREGASSPPQAVSSSRTGPQAVIEGEVVPRREPAREDLPWLEES